MKHIGHFLAFVLFSIQTVKSQVAYVWNGSSSTDWGTSTNWTPNGIPGSADNVTIVTGANTCLLNASTSITNITMTSGVLNLNGFTLNPSGNAVFTSGTITNGTLLVNGSSGNTATLSNTTFSPSAILTITTGAITLNSGTYGGAVTLNQTGTTSTSGGTGGAIFNSSLSITNNSTGNFRMYGNNTYNGACTFINNGGGDFLPELSRGSTYNAGLTLTNTSTTGNTRMAYAGNTTFNGSLILNNTGNANFTFCEQGTATATLASGQTISIGSSGFSVGILYLQRFTQTGSTAQNLNLTGTAVLQFGPSSTFGGNVTTSSSGLLLNGCTFNGTLNATKTGASNDGCSGNNIFNAAFTLTNSGSGYIVLGNISADQYNAASTFNNTGSNNIYVAYNSANNTFAGVATFNNAPSANSGIYVSWSTNATNTTFNNNIVVTSTSGAGVQFCGTATSSAILSAGNTISIGSAGFSAGTLALQRFTQTGATAQNYALAGTGVILFGPASTFGGNQTISAGGIVFNGGTFNGLVNATKTGASSDNGLGGNIFNGTTVITSTGSGQLTFGSGNADQFNASTTFNNNGSYRITIANNHAGQTTSFASDVTFNTAKTGGVDAWSYLIAESANTNISFAGNVTLNCSGALQSTCRMLQGASSVATFNGAVTINLSNSNAATQLLMGTNGTSTYNSNIIVI